MKRVAQGLCLLLFSVFGFNIGDVVASECYDATAQLTGYYTPVANQARYSSGSFAGDSRMNGDDTTASGQKVGPGVLAAPGSYPFGTQIILPDLGNGLGGGSVVADRGGAIKVYGGVPRFDVWTGYGDDGLNKALQLGKRTVIVKICGGDAANLASLKVADKPLNSAVADIAVKSTEVDKVAVQKEIAEAYKVFKQVVIDEPDSQATPLVMAEVVENGAIVPLRREIFLTDVPTRKIGLGAVGDDVTKLQLALRALGYEIDVTGVYDKSTMEVVSTFQLNEKLVAKNSTTTVGYFEEATQILLLQNLLKFDFPEFGFASMLKFNEEMVIA